jgi:hypothetical protein
MMRRASIKSATLGAARIAFFSLAALLTFPAYGQSGRYVMLLCDGERSRSDGVNERIQRTYFTDMISRRFCSGVCGEIHVSPHIDEKSIEFLLRSPPGDEVSLAYHVVHHRFDRRTGVLSGTEVSSGGTLYRYVVAARCTIRSLSDRRIIQVLNNAQD